jgi:hypothetical protein
LLLLVAVVEVVHILVLVITERVAGAVLVGLEQTYLDIH